MEVYQDSAPSFLNSIQIPEGCTIHIDRNRSYLLWLAADSVDAKRRSSLAVLSGHFLEETCFFEFVDEARFDETFGDSRSANRGASVPITASSI